MNANRLALFLIPSLAACATPAPQAEPAPAGQPVVRDYDEEAITGSHLKRRSSTLPPDARTLAPAALEDWQRQRTGPKGPGSF
jgi:uncharacterized lipoprotein YbaY